MGGGTNPIGAQTNVQYPQAVGTVQSSQLNAALAKIDAKFSELNEIKQKISDQEKMLAAIPEENTSSRDAMKELIKSSKKEWLEKNNDVFLVITSQTAELNQKTAMPKEIAGKLITLLVNYGISGYGNLQFHSEQNEKDLEKYTLEQKKEVAFGRPLSVLKASYEIIQFALGITNHHMDLSAVPTIRDLFLPSNTKEQIDTHFKNAQIHSAEWSNKTQNLAQTQIVELSKNLRYTNGAIRYLTPQPDDAALTLAEKLLGTAEAILVQARNNSNCDKKEIENELAELIYNDLTGLAIWKANRAKSENKPEEARSYDQQILHMIDDAIALSADPEKMRNRCNNKFADLLAQERGGTELDYRKEALKGHLSLPKERQNPVLIALAYNNVARTHIELGNLNEAIKCYEEGMNYVKEAEKAGELNVQFDTVRKNYEVALKISQLIIG